PFYDSLLVKVSASGLTFEESCRRMDRALGEWRVRGVRTNLPFLRNVINHAKFRAGDATTTFIADAPELRAFQERFDRPTKILPFIGDVSVNGNPEIKGARPANLRKPVVPPYDIDAPVPPGSRDQWKKLGSEKFFAGIRDEKRLLLTDTTL